MSCPIELFFLDTDRVGTQVIRFKIEDRVFSFHKVARSGTTNVYSVCPVCVICLYLHITLPIKLRFLWKFKLKPLRYQLFIPTYLIQVGYPLWHYKTWGSQNYQKKIPLSLSIQLRNLWNFKLKLLSYQLFILACLIQVGYPK